MTEEPIQFLEEKNRIKEEFVKKLKNKQYLLKVLEINLEECRTWKSVEKEGLLLQANLYRVDPLQKTIEVEDFENGSKITLFLEGSTKEDILSRFFKKARRLKRGEKSVQKKIEDVKKEIEFFDAELLKIDNALNIKDLRPFKSEKILKPKSRVQKKIPYREYASHSGYRILVGKSKKDNDALTFKVGSPHDVWLHANDYPGSHVIIKAKRNEEPDPMTVEEAALLAIESSGAKDKPMADVAVARQKNLKRIKGRPGQVMVSQKKVKRVINDRLKLQAVKERKIIT